MSLTFCIYAAVGLFWSMAIFQGILLTRASLRLRRHVKRAVANRNAMRDGRGAFIFQPKASIILPCCGIDEKLRQTVSSLARQNYADYEIVFTVESSDDPAHAALLEWTRDWQTPP